MRKVSKAYVHYRIADGDQHCGSCAMYRHKQGGGAGRCDLVEGFIEIDHVCDRWTTR